MLFTLEAVQAKFGDCLLLHFGTYQDAAPRLIVIDGGPPGTYQKYLEPRLKALKEARSPGAPLDIDLLMVSHVDADHVAGVMEMTNSLVTLNADNNELPFNILTVWLNSFADLTNGKGGEVSKAVGAATGAAFDSFHSALGEFLEKEKPDTELIGASVAQGQQVANNAGTLGIARNYPFGGLIAAPAEGGPRLAPQEQGVTLTLLCPLQEQVDALHKEWDKKMAELKDTAKPKEQAEAAEYIDNSVYNLSSIVVLAEKDGRRMLLTGDGRGDIILRGLELAGVIPAGGTLKVDLLKMPHHGSVRDVAASFFERIKADHYLFSANGHDDNPDLPTLKLLTGARGDDEYAIYVTNEVPHCVKFFAEDRAANPSRKYVVHTGGLKPPYLRVDLGDEKLSD